MTNQSLMSNHSVSGLMLSSYEPVNVAHFEHKQIIASG